MRTPLTPVNAFSSKREGELVEDIDEVVRMLGSEQNKKLYGYFLDGEFDEQTLVNTATALGTLWAHRLPVTIRKRIERGNKA